MAPVASEHRPGTPLVEMSGVTLAFGTVSVLEGFDFSVKPGEVHAVVGEHGAGKSSMARILAGIQRPDAGKLTWEGKALPLLNVRSATRLGIELVSQETELFEHQTVAENLFSNRRDVFRGLFYSPRRIHAEAERYLASMHVETSAHATIRSLAYPERVLIDILRHLRLDPRLLILDESLERLTAPDFRSVRDALRALAGRGSSVLFITHRIEDIYELAQRVTIIRKGKRLVTEDVSRIDTVSLIKLAYTQVSASRRTGDINREFYQFLKFNEAILERLPVNLVVVDRKQAVKLMNRNAVEYFGVAASELQGRPVDSLFAVGNGAATAHVLEALVEHRGDVLYDVALTVGGRERRVDIVVNPILDGATYIGSMIIINDRTDQEKMLGRIALSERLASIGLLSAGVAHEINNPLETIYNYLDLLKLKVREEGAFDTLVRLEEEVGDIEQIVGNLIAFSEDKAVETERFDLVELVEGLAALVLPNARRRKVEVEFQRPVQEIPVTANRTEMKQVVLNLARNSLDAMPDGGFLNIELGVERLDDTEWAVIRVEDSGCGIPAELRDQIFVPFYSTKSRSEGHMGLGLSIIYGIVTRIHGRIDAENLPTRGSRFTVRIPTGC